MGDDRATDDRLEHPDEARDALLVRQVGERAYRAPRVAHDDRLPVPGALVDDRRPPPFDRIGDDEVVRPSVGPQRLVERQRDLLERAPAGSSMASCFAGERRVEPMAPALTPRAGR